MTMYPIIKNPEFIDRNKTYVRVLLEDETGKTTVAEFKVPENRELGVNEFWDRITQEFDIDEMSKKRDELERKRIIEAERLDKKKKAQVESNILRALFDQKLYFFNLPFIDELSDEEKSAIRRAPNLIMLNIVATSVMINYMQRTGKTFINLFDEIEDKEFEEVNNKNENMV